MPSKLDFYAQMADHTAKQVTGSFGEWTAFLETMGRLYKYPFHEQLMISLKSQTQLPVPITTFGISRWADMSVVAPRVSL